MDTNTTYSSRNRDLICNSSSYRLYEMSNFISKKYQSQFQTFRCVTFPFVGTLYSFLCPLFKFETFKINEEHPLSFICNLSERYNPYRDSRFKVTIDDLRGKDIEFSSPTYGNVSIYTKIQTIRKIELISEDYDSFEDAPTEDNLICPIDLYDQKDYNFLNSEIGFIGKTEYYLDSLLCTKEMKDFSSDKIFKLEFPTLADHLLKGESDKVGMYITEFMDTFISSVRPDPKETERRCRNPKYD